MTQMIVSMENSADVTNIISTMKCVIIATIGNCRQNLSELQKDLKNVK